MEKKQEIYKLNQLIPLIEQWSRDRGLDQQDVFKQFCKLQEEVGELSVGLLKDWHIGELSRIKDAIGDITVVLIVLTTQLGIDYKECLGLAYEVIKNRKGKTINGVFIKEEDLKPKQTDLDK